MRPPGESLWRRHWRHQRTGPGEYFLRSEEHTSELQSRLHLVCRLLLEKNKSSNMLFNGVRSSWDMLARNCDLSVLMVVSSPAFRSRRWLLSLSSACLVCRLARYSARSL